jgi:hypothetical protein
MTGRKADNTKARKAGLTAAASYAKAERARRDEAPSGGSVLALGKSGLGWGAMTVLMPGPLWDALRVHAVTTKQEMSVIVAQLVEADLAHKGLVEPGIVAAELNRRPSRGTK